MDPPQTQHEPLQGQYSSTDELPKSLPNGTPVYEYLDVFPEDNLHESSLDGLITNPKPPPSADPPSTKRPVPVPVRAPPPPPRRRLPSEYFPTGQDHGPPRVPPRSHEPLLQRQLSLMAPKPEHKLTRSRTEGGKFVSIVPHQRQRAALTTHINVCSSSTSGAVRHPTHRHATGQHQESGVFVCCHHQVRESSCIFTDHLSLAVYTRNIKYARTDPRPLLSFNKPADMNHFYLRLCPVIFLFHSGNLFFFPAGCCRVTSTRTALITQA